MPKPRRPDKRPPQSVASTDNAGAARSATALAPRWAWVLAAFAGVALLAALAWQLSRAPSLNGTQPAPAAVVAPAFVGSGECTACHEQQAAAWSTSQHARAMQHATPETVRGNFNDAKFVFQGVTTSFFRRDGKFIARTDGPDGKLADFEVRYTFGVEPLQQYLVELPGGRLQALSVTWDTRPKEDGGQRWFRQYPDEKIDFRDELHWTKRTQNWNFMCADCHSSQVVKGYDSAANSFKTSWKEISVGCESCHGPGSAHLAWARTRSVDVTKGLTVQLDERRDVTWSIEAASGSATRSRERASAREIEVCAQCHARRAQIAEGYQPGAPFLDHYLPSLLVPGLYYVDGQQRDEVFIWGSWMQSRMHRKGVTCSDCHDPHTQKLRVNGNAVCGQCHAPGKYDAPSHHHHQGDSAGARCADCHMPKTAYMVIDRRRDHSMRVPRPDQSVAFGVPNACNQCHTDHDAEWAAAAVRGWLGRDAKGFQDFAATFHAAETHRPGAIASLAAIANDVAAAPITRATSVERIALAGGGDAATAQRAAQDVQPLVRLASVRLAEALPMSVQARLLAPLLADPLRAVRIEAARALAGQQDGLSAQQRVAWQSAADEYLATLEYTADRPEARVALGSFEARRGRHEQAQAAFAQALALDPDFVPAYLNAADDWRAQGNEAQARAALQSGLTRDPKNAALRHAFGLALVRAGEQRKALQEFDRAVQLAPDELRYTYVYAVALNSTGRQAQAIKTLDRATARWPANRDLLMALATMQRDAGHTEAARRAAAKLVQEFPGDPEVNALARQLR